MSVRIIGDGDKKYKAEAEKLKGVIDNNPGCFFSVDYNDWILWKPYKEEGEDGYEEWCDDNWLASSYNHEFDTITSFGGLGLALAAVMGVEVRDI